MKTLKLKKVLLVLCLLLPTTVVWGQDTTTVTSPPKTAEPAAEPAVAPSTDEKVENKGGIFVEPFLTYERNDIDVDFPSPLSGTSDKIDGFGLGARLGFHIHDIMFIGLDGRYSKPQYESDVLNGKGDADAYNLGATFGVQTPLAGLRVWGTYIFDGMLNPDSIDSVNVKFSKFTGYRIGAGLYVASFSINLEYQDADYDKTTLEEVGVLSPGDADRFKAKSSGYILSVSFPIAI